MFLNGRHPQIETVLIVDHENQFGLIVFHFVWIHGYRTQVFSIAGGEKGQSPRNILTYLGSKIQICQPSSLYRVKYTIFKGNFLFLLRIFLLFYHFANLYNIELAKHMQSTTFMREILPNLPHLLKPSSEPGSLVSSSLFLNDFYHNIFLK